MEQTLKKSRNIKKSKTNLFINAVKYINLFGKDEEYQENCVIVTKNKEEVKKVKISQYEQSYCFHKVKRITVCCNKDCKKRRRRNLIKPDDNVTDENKVSVVKKVRELSLTTAVKLISQGNCKKSFDKDDSNKILSKPVGSSISVFKKESKKSLEIKTKVKKDSFNGKKNSINVNDNKSINESNNKVISFPTQTLRKSPRKNAGKKKVDNKIPPKKRGRPRKSSNGIVKNQNKLSKTIQNKIPNLDERICISCKSTFAQEKVKLLPISKCMTNARTNINKCVQNNANTAIKLKNNINNEDVNKQCMTTDEEEQSVLLNTSIDKVHILNISDPVEIPREDNNGKNNNKKSEPATKPNIKPKTKIINSYISERSKCLDENIVNINHGNTVFSKEITSVANNINLERQNIEVNVNLTIPDLILSNDCMAETLDTNNVDITLQNESGYNISSIAENVPLNQNSNNITDGNNRTNRHISDESVLSSCARQQVREYSDNSNSNMNPKLPEVAIDLDMRYTNPNDTVDHYVKDINRCLEKPMLDTQNKNIVMSTKSTLECNTIQNNRSLSDSFLQESTESFHNEIIAISDMNKREIMMTLINMNKTSIIEEDTSLNIQKSNSEVDQNNSSKYNNKTRKVNNSTNTGAICSPIRNIRKLKKNSISNILYNQTPRYPSSNVKILSPKEAQVPNQRFNSKNCILPNMNYNQNMFMINRQNTYCTKNTSNNMCHQINSGMPDQESNLLTYVNLPNKYYQESIAMVNSQPNQRVHNIGGKNYANFYQDNTQLQTQTSNNIYNLKKINQMHYSIQHPNLNSQNVHATCNEGNPTCGRKNNIWMSHTENNYPERQVRYPSLSDSRFNDTMYYDIIRKMNPVCAQTTQPSNLYSPDRPQDSAYKNLVMSQTYTSSSYRHHDDPKLTWQPQIPTPRYHCP